MGAIFKKGFSFSGYERDLLSLNLGDGSFLDVSGISGIDSISDGRGAQGCARDVEPSLSNDGTGDVKGNVAASDHDHPPTESGRTVQAYIPQQVDPAIYADPFVPRNRYRT